MLKRVSVLSHLSRLSHAAALSTDDDTSRGSSDGRHRHYSNCRWIDTKVGTGAEARPGRVVRVHYTGWLYDASKADKRGQKFDSSKDRNDPFEFPLGGGQVIPGWDKGFAGMKVGGTRVLTIPPAMGYGARGAGGVIPPNATLVFEVELLEVK